MLMPARVVATLTEEHKRSVEASASGIELRNLRLRIGRALVYKRRIAADEINANVARCSVDGLRELNRVATRSFGNH